MNKIILKIKEAMKNQGLSETKAATIADVSPRTVNRMLSGQTAKPDINVINKLMAALGIVAEPGEQYVVTSVHRALKPEEENLLKMLEDYPDAREVIEAMIQLPERKRKIHLGEILKDLDKLEEEGKK